MNLIELLPRIDAIIKTCMQIEPGQVVFIVTDSKRLEFGELLMALVNQMGAEASLGLMTVRKMHGNEFPEPVGAGLLEAHHVILALSKTSAHTSAVKKAREKGVFIGSFSSQIDIEEYLMKYLITKDDLNLIWERVLKVTQLFSEAKEALVTTELGTNLWVDLAGRSGVPVHPFTKEAEVSIFPDYSEVAISPREGSAKGHIVVDGTVGGIGLVHSPLTLTIEDGRLVKIQGDSQAQQLEDILSKEDEHAFNIAEFGIGLSHTGDHSSRSTWDKKNLGTAHIGLGRSDRLGGEVYSSIHIDTVFRKATLKLDGKTILSNNRLLI